MLSKKAMPSSHLSITMENPIRMVDILGCV